MNQLILYCQTMIVAMTESIYKIRNREALFIFEDNKRREGALFVAKLTCDDQLVDRQFAYKVCQEMLLYYAELQKKQVKNYFEEYTKGKRDNFRWTTKMESMEKEALDMADL